MHDVFRLRYIALLLTLSLAAANTQAQDIYKDLVFDNEGHTLDVYRANPAGPTVFYVPGGGWYKHDKNLYTRLGVALAGYGINLVIPQYGPEQTYPNNLYDVIEAVRWSQANLSSYGISSTQFHLVGHSAGAQLAYMTLADHRTSLSESDFLSLTLISGLYDINLLVKMGNGFRNWNLLQGWHASPIKAKRLVALPMTVIWAENDYDLVKRQTNHFLAANAKICQPLQAYIIPCDDHITELVNAETNGLLQIVVNTANAGSGVLAPAPTAPVESSVPMELTPPVQETEAVAPAPVSPPVPTPATEPPKAPTPAQPAEKPAAPAPAPAAEAPKPAAPAPAVEAPKPAAPAPAPTKPATPAVEAPKPAAPAPTKPAAPAPAPAPVLEAPKPAAPAPAPTKPAAPAPAPAPVLEAPKPAAPAPTPAVEAPKPAAPAPAPALEAPKPAAPAPPATPAVTKPSASF